MINTRKLEHQVKVFKRIQIYRHGFPSQIYADGEYCKGEFKFFCDNNEIKMIPIAANGHEVNGAIESANNIIKNFLRRLRIFDKKSEINEILSEATYVKNICKGDKLASSFELLYGRKPPILREYYQSGKIINLDEQNSHKARQRIFRMVNSKTLKYPNLKIGDYVYFWRDNSGWIGPGKIVESSENNVKILHNSKLKTSSWNKVQKTLPPIEPEEDSLDQGNQEALQSQVSSSIHEQGEESESASTPVVELPQNNESDTVQLLNDEMTDEEDENDSDWTPEEDESESDDENYLSHHPDMACGEKHIYNESYDAKG